MAEFINTVDVIGDEALTDSIISRRITECNDDNIISIGMDAFRDCTALASCKFLSATSIGSEAFRNCTALATGEFPSVTDIADYAFYDCSSLSSIYFPNVMTIGENAFAGCTLITNVCFADVTTINNSTFSDCAALASADFPSATSIGTYVFNGCTALKSLILRNQNGVCTLGGTDSLNKTAIKSRTGYIYVPAALVDSYKAATNWSTFASQFRALEDYTVDGTTTGELDPNKI